MLAARLTAWAFDGALIALVCSLFVALAAIQLGGRKLAPLGAQSWESWADGLLFAHRLPIFWGLLCAAIAVGYSWLFAALGGGTPDMRVAGLQLLLHEDGTPLDPLRLRSARRLRDPLGGARPLRLPPGAGVDPRGQTAVRQMRLHSLLVARRRTQRGSTGPL